MCIHTCTHNVYILTAYAWTHRDKYIYKYIKCTIYIREYAKIYTQLNKNNNRPDFSLKNVFMHSSIDFNLWTLLNGILRTYSKLPKVI